MFRDISEVKKMLKISILARGYKNVDDYAKKSKTGYSVGTIKMSLTPNHITSDKIISEIAKELGFNLEIEERKTYRIIRGEE